MQERNQMEERKKTKAKQGTFTGLLSSSGTSCSFIMLWDRANTARDLSGALPWYIWISLFRSFRLRCTVHPQQGQPQPVGGGFQPGEPEHSQLITVQTIWRSAFMFWLIDFRCFLWLCWWLSRWTSWTPLPYPFPHHDSSLEGVSVWIYHFIQSYYQAYTAW